MTAGIFRAAGLALLTVVVATACGRGTSSEPPGHIGFTSNRGGDAEVWLSDANGGNAKRVVPGLQPAWSPDGSEIVYVSPPMLDLFLMKADGTPEGQLSAPPNGNSAQPAWSPDGQWIAFASEVDHNQDIYKVRRDGSGLTRLTDDPAPDSNPAWSPDGGRLAFTSHRGGDYELYLMNADGEGQKRITFSPDRDDHARWSPDGKKIAFDSFRIGSSQIYVMNVDGTGLQQLTGDPTVHSYGPYWSPDGQWIAYTHVLVENNTENPEIFAVKADSSGLVRITNDPAVDIVQAWPP